MGARQFRKEYAPNVSRNSEKVENYFVRTGKNAATLFNPLWRKVENFPLF